MPFFAKFLGRKKQGDKLSASNSSSEASASPLEGKFEYVIPSPLPVKTDYPHLSLNLPERRESRALDNVFGNADLVGKTRLSPEQTLTIVRACSQAIIARGLETLGIMHPHWHSASPATQQRLILLFIQSSATVFESEISSTRPHDVAAVLRWAIRHLQLPDTSFGNNSSWYSQFFDSEISASYPTKSFSEMLAPQLPSVNLDLLTTTLDLFSSLAAHSEANSISGSKLSKLLGLWLLTAERSTPNNDFLSFYERWDRHGRILEHLFLSRIRNETANHRMPKRLVELVKHYPYTNHSQSSPDRDLLPRPRFSTRHYDALFVHIETELPLSGAKPTRVSLQMVADALNATYPTQHAPPYSAWRKVQQAATSDNEEPLYSPGTGKYPGIGRILSDETLAALSSIAGEETPPSSISFVSNVDNGITRSTSTQSASSHDDATKQHSNPIGLDWNSFSTSGFLQSTPLMTPLAETLLGKDTEITSPSPSRKGSRKSAKAPTHPSRRSLDVLPPISIPTLDNTVYHIQNGSSLPNRASSQMTKVELVSLDEAFIDFWNDSLLDPITEVEAWPKFIICKLKGSAVPEIESGEGGRGQKTEWLVISQSYVKPTPPSPPPVSPSAEGTAEVVATSATSSKPVPRASSPSPSSVSASVKRFSFWGGSKKDKGDKEESSSPTRKGKGAKGKVSELGEILTEEKSDEPPKKSVDVPAPVKEEQEEVPEKDIVDSKAKDKEAEAEKATESKDKKSLGGESVPTAGIAAVATGVVAAGVAAVVAETADKVGRDEEKAKPEEEEKNISASTELETSVQPAAELTASVPEQGPISEAALSVPEPPQDSKESEVQATPALVSSNNAVPVEATRELEAIPVANTHEDISAPELAPAAAVVAQEVKESAVPEVAEVALAEGTTKEEPEVKETLELVSQPLTPVATKEVSLPEPTSVVGEEVKVDEPVVQDLAPESPMIEGAVHREFEINKTPASASAIAPAVNISDGAVSVPAEEASQLEPAPVDNEKVRIEEPAVPEISYIKDAVETPLAEESARDITPTLATETSQAVAPVDGTYTILEKVPRPESDSEAKVEEPAVEEPVPAVEKVDEMSVSEEPLEAVSDATIIAEVEEPVVTDPVPEPPVAQKADKGPVSEEPPEAIPDAIVIAEVEEPAAEDRVPESPVTEKVEEAPVSEEPPVAIPDAPVIAELEEPAAEDPVLEPSAAEKVEEAYVSREPSEAIPHASVIAEVEEPTAEDRVPEAVAEQVHEAPPSEQSFEAIPDAPVTAEVEEPAAEDRVPEPSVAEQAHEAPVSEQPREAVPDASIITEVEEHAVEGQVPEFSVAKEVGEAPVSGESSEAIPDVPAIAEVEEPATDQVPESPVAEKFDEAPVSEESPEAIPDAPIIAEVEEHEAEVPEPLVTETVDETPVPKELPEAIPDVPVIAEVEGPAIDQLPESPVAEKVDEAPVSEESPEAISDASIIAEVEEHKAEAPEPLVTETVDETPVPKELSEAIPDVPVIAEVEEPAIDQIPESLVAEKFDEAPVSEESPEAIPDAPIIAEVEEHEAEVPEALVTEKVDETPVPKELPEVIPDVPVIAEVEEPAIDQVPESPVAEKVDEAPVSEESPEAIPDAPIITEVEEHKAEVPEPPVTEKDDETPVPKELPEVIPDVPVIAEVEEPAIEELVFESPVVEERSKVPVSQEPSVPISEAPIVGQDIPTDVKESIAEEPHAVRDAAQVSVTDDSATEKHVADLPETDKSAAEPSVAEETAIGEEFVAKSLVEAPVSEESISKPVVEEPTVEEPSMPEDHIAEKLTIEEFVPGVLAEGAVAKPVESGEEAAPVEGPIKEHAELGAADDQADSAPETVESLVTETFPVTSGEATESIDAGSSIVAQQEIEEVASSSEKQLPLDDREPTTADAIATERIRDENGSHSEAKVQEAGAKTEPEPKPVESESTISSG